MDAEQVKHLIGNWSEQLLLGRKGYGSKEIFEAIDAMQADIDRLRKSRRDLLEMLQGVLKCQRGVRQLIYLEGWQEEAVKAAVNKAMSEETKGR